MFKKLVGKFNRMVKKQFPSRHRTVDHVIEENPLSPNLEQNIQRLKEIFDSCSDVVFREFKIGTERPIRALLLYIDGLSEKSMLTDNVLKSLMLDINGTHVGAELNPGSVFRIIENQIVTLLEVKQTGELTELVNCVLCGDAVLLFDGEPRALVAGAVGWEARSVSEPETETVVRGPRDGFTESLRTNTSLLRRRIKTSRMKMETMQVGLLTKTEVVIVYIKGIANDKVVEEVRRRLKDIKIDGILESGYIEELIEDAPYSPFPQVAVTERPDKVAGGLLEGQVAILVDTTPFVLIVPVTFYQLMQASEDYYNRYPFVTAVRLLRFFSLNVALLLPSLYIAIATFHQEMLPTPLLISIAGAREGVPFPAFVEALLMEFTFEVLREAGIRLPRPVGQAVSIVGALVIGEAAVTAGLVSPAMVIVVSLTAIASFTIPNAAASFAIRILRFPMMALAAVLGLFGVMVGLMAVLIHLCALRSFGVPYLSPIAPTSWGDLKDVLVRTPWWATINRPRLIAVKEPVRQDGNLKPEPPPPGNQ